MQYPNLVAYLDTSAPGTVEQLRQKHPDSMELFSSARILGEEKEEPGDEGKATRVAHAALRDLVQATVARIKNSLDQIANAIRERMKSISRMKFFGAFVAAVSGGIGAILTYIGFGHESIALSGAVAGMLGGVVGLCADYFEKAPSGIRIAGVDEYAKLIEMIGNVELFKMQIDRDTVLPVADDQLKAMLEKLDVYSLQVIRLSRA
jgi:hypothetical protein